MSDNDSDKTDLTRIEDLNEFFHNKDEETEAKLNAADIEAENTDEAEDNETSQDLTPPPLDEDNFESTENTNESSAPFDQVEDSNSFASNEEADSWSNNEAEDSNQEENDWGDSETEFPEDSDQEFKSQFDDHYEDGEAESLGLTEEEQQNSFADTNEQIITDNDSATFENSDFADAETEPSATLDAEEPELELESEADPIIEPEPKLPEPIAEKIESAVASQSEPSSKHESFNEIKQFGNALNISEIKTGGNPPWGIIVKDIKYEEDAADIFDLLKQLSLINDSNQDQMKKALDYGQIIIPQISEYSAVILAHKLRRFQVELQVGLMESLHPSPVNEDYKGHTSRHQTFPNREESATVTENHFELDDILLTTTPIIEQKSIKKYLGIVTESVLTDDDELNNSSSDIASENKEAELLNQYSVSSNEIYANLANGLKNPAFKMGANAVVGITFQLTTLPDSSDLISSSKLKIKMTCMGSAVWVD